jgi:hypothetical protein
MVRIASLIPVGILVTSIATAAPAVGYDETPSPTQLDDQCGQGLFWCNYPGQPNNGMCCVSGQACCYDPGTQIVWCSSNNCN